MNELAIQAEVGRRLRAAMSRHPNKFRINAEEGADREIVRMIDELVASGQFTDQDRGALQATTPATLKAVYAKMASAEVAETLEHINARSVGANVSEYTMADAMLAQGRITTERHKQMKAQERDQQQRRVHANMLRHHAHTAPSITPNAAEQEYLRGMIPPSTRRAK